MNATGHRRVPSGSGRGRGGGGEHVALGDAAGFAGAGDRGGIDAGVGGEAADGGRRRWILWRGGGGRFGRREPGAATPEAAESMVATTWPIFTSSPAAAEA
jgi:hypothetical protein